MVTVYLSKKAGNPKVLCACICAYRLEIFRNCCGREGSDMPLLAIEYSWPDVSLDSKSIPLLSIRPQFTLPLFYRLITSFEKSGSTLP